MGFPERDHDRGREADQNQQAENQADASQEKKPERPGFFFLNLDAHQLQMPLEQADERAAQLFSDGLGASEPGFASICGSPISDV